MASSAPAFSRTGGDLLYSPLPLAAIVIVASAFGNRNRTKARQLSECVVFCLMMMAFVSRAGVSNGGGGGGQPPPPVTYHITVTGTSSGTAPDAGQSTTRDTRRKLKGFVAYDYAVVNIARRPPA